MPYWNRLPFLERTLDSYRRYEDIEVCIADDGCGLELEEYPFPVRIVHLPEKSVPMNPCVPFNRARELAGGEVLCITNPEVCHPSPVFPAMLEALGRLGRRGYVLASCWNPERNRWHCAKGYVPPKAERIPEGSGLHFCAVMRADFYDEIGGFDERYRNGAGFDDNDFIWSVHKAGGRIEIIDEIVHHYNTPNAWKQKDSERNRRLFVEKWTPYWSRS